MGKKHDAFIKRIENVQRELAPAAEAYMDEVPKQCRGDVLAAADSLDSAFAIVRMLADGDKFADMSDRDAAEAAIRLVTLAGAVSKLKDMLDDAIKEG